MNNTDRLLNDLNNMIPVSAGFWNDLPSLMVEKQKKSGYVFLKNGKMADKAWQLLSGYIVVIGAASRGRDVASRVYCPQDIVTDLKSFFEDKHVDGDFVAVGDVSVLEIKKADVMRLLDKHPEVNKLVQHITFLDNSFTDYIIILLGKTPKERVKTFLEKYPVQDLEHKHVASILHMTEESYIETLLVLESEGFFPAKLRDPDEGFINSTDTAYRVKGYLLNNYTNPDIGGTDEIAEIFHTTSRTLNRNFKKSFGITVNKFVLKRRMEKAYELLQEQQLPVGEVGLAVGYKNIYHFSLEFKKYYGHSPRTIKKP